MSRRNWERVRIETRDSKQPRKYKPSKPNRHKQQKQNQNTRPAPSCPLCNFPMVRRNGSSGPFWGCHQFPRCKGTRE
jgi:ssDNA-binding Zn-finger/Zn-ribbon topoisomerase 1